MISKGDLSSKAQKWYQETIDDYKNFVETTSLLGQEESKKVKKYVDDIKQNIDIIKNDKIEDPQQQKKKIKAYEDLKACYECLISFVSNRQNFVEAKRAAVDVEIMMLRNGIDPEKIEYVVVPSSDK